MRPRTLTWSPASLIIPNRSANASRSSMAGPGGVSATRERGSRGDRLVSSAEHEQHQSNQAFISRISCKLRCKIVPYPYSTYSLL